MAALPRPEHASVRDGLLREAARLILDEGPSGLNLRRLADQVGTSTMAVYTHFGGMEGLRGAVREEGFGRLANRLSGVPAGRGALERLAWLCLAYYEHGVAESDVYRVMFLEQRLDEHDAEICAGTFETLAAGVHDCVEAGELNRGDPAAIAGELWGLGHGFVALRLSDLMPPEEVDARVRDALFHLLVGLGADAVIAQRAVAAQARRSS